MKKTLLSFPIAVLLSFMTLTGSYAAEINLLNVSYDPTRELYKDFNQAFAKYWKDKTGDTVTINQSHGGSGKQARAVLDGLEADVVTLGLAYDIDQLASRVKLIPENWQARLPNNSSPYTSTIVFVVHKGNPKNIKEWDDLVKPGVNIITPNPKTSGGARWNYLAAWAYALKKNANNEEAGKEFLSKLYKNTSVLDTGARGSTTSFAERGLGDVLITWENEAYLVLKEFGADQYDVITPSFSILAEPPVSLVDSVAAKHGTTEVANAYLNYLYTQDGQEVIAKNYYRPYDKEIAAKYAKQFPNLELVTVAQLGGWTALHNKHFADDGIFDKIYGK